MKRIGICGGLFLLSGCLTSDGLSTLAQSETNITSLTLLRQDMEECEVLQIMHMPYCEETYTIGDDQYDVFFYITSPTILGQTRMVHNNLTPLTFKNDHLVSKDWAYYKWVRNQQNAQPEPQVPPAPPMGNAEEKKGEYEKILSPSETSDQPEENEGLEKPLNESENPAEPSDQPEENKGLEKPLNEPEKPVEPSNQSSNPPATQQPISNPPNQTVSQPVTQPVNPPPAANPNLEKALNQPASQGIPAVAADTDDHEKALNPPKEKQAPAKPAQQKKGCPKCPGLLEVKLVLGDSNSEDKAARKEVDLDEEDQQMLQSEQEQDFNFW